MSNIRIALVWSMLDRIFTVAMGFASVTILARLLTPAEVGVFGVAYSVVGLSQTLRDFGTSSYLIQEKELTPQRIRSAFGVTLLTGWTLGGTIFLLADTIAAFYGQPELATVLRIICLTLVLWPFGSPILSLLRRDMRFKTLSFIGMATALAQPTVAVTLVYLGYSYYGLAWAVVAEVAVSVLLTTILRPKETWMWPSLREWRRVGVFGLSMAGISLIGSLNTYASDLVLGRTLGFVNSGFYSRATGLISLFRDRIWGGGHAVLMSEFARLHRENGDVKGSFLRASVMVTGIFWPLFALLALMALPVVRILFGLNWDDSVPLVRLLACAAMISVPWFPGGTLLLATGHVTLQLRLSIVMVAVQIPALILLSHLGLIWVPLVSVLTGLIMAGMLGIYTRRILGLAAGEVWLATLRSVPATLGICVVPLLVLVFCHPEPRLGEPWLWVAGFGAILGAVIGYYAVSHPMAGEIDAILRKLRRRSFIG
ncbi:lipopolysaccharide biosynthesis protein [Rhodospirillum rubrum]|uniref:lipopolysaccharide biosynthesis protein n=1 Tax=Rhodospirillum rubrum TaxID=1085 RepID=UPI0027DE9460|nr:lipopolysaccharide biosynthesis protein [Rhodospirillum rubrum]